MRTLKWVLGIIIILAFLLGIVTPFVIGIWVQKIYPSVFLGSANASTVKMTLLDYNRGIFSSTAKVALSFSNANTTNRIVFDQKIQHGPLVFENRPRLALALITSESDDSNFKANTRTIWKLSRRIVTDITIPSIDVSSPPIHFVLHNLKMRMNYHSVLQTLEADAKIDKLELQSANPSPFTINFTNITSTQNLNKINSIWYGTRSGSVEKIDILGPQGPVAQINSLSASGSVSADNGKTNVQVNYQTKNSSILNTPFASLDFAFSIRNIDSKALSNLLIKLEEKNQVAPGNTASTAALSESAFELISKGLLIQLDHLSIMTAEGEAKAAGSLSLPALASGNIFQMLGALKLDLNIQVPKASLMAMLSVHYQNDKTLPSNLSPAQYAQQQVEQWIQEKVLIPSANDLLLMKVQFENSKLLVNGVVQQPGAPNASPVASPNPPGAIATSPISPAVTPVPEAKPATMPNPAPTHSTSAN